MSDDWLSRARERLAPVHGAHSFPENEAYCAFCQAARVFDALDAATQRARDLEAGQRDLLRVCDQLTEENRALRAEVTAHVEARGLLSNP